MIRRFVNLVLEEYYGSRKYSLHRLDVAKYLFYPSTAQAEAANAKESNNGGGGVGDKPNAPKPPRIKRLRRLPEPSMRFSPFPPADDGEDKRYRGSSFNDDTFILLSPGSSEGRILHATEGGRTVVYDADADAVSATASSFPARMERWPIAFSVPGAGGFMEEKESLYVMRSTIRPPPPPKYNHYDPAPKEQDPCSGDFVVLDFNKPFEWQRLPRPPFVPDGDRPGSGSYSDIRIGSSTVVDGGRTILSPSFNVERTYCFDTATRQWRHAGDWALPFYGRAEYVPELGTWIGLSSSPPHHLCASDLAAAMDAHRAPTLQHVWDDFTPPPDKDSSIVLNRRFPLYVLSRWTEWSLLGVSLVNLGSGRFCILKVFNISRSESVGFSSYDSWSEEKEFTVLTGVEVVRCHDGEGGLRMVKHKSRRCEFGSNHWLL
uniref:Uncharacterized protein n=1 Tax=Setaria viridis TaxID=4556 RepID=A0A4U6VP63_SETVI|nr:LOW QUALITY PROTEIN: hypothetical protein SEVIR_2G054300v2 [Setaria viridis]